MFISVAVFGIFELAHPEVDAVPALIGCVPFLHVLAEHFRVVYRPRRFALAVKVAAVDYDCVFLHSASFLAQNGKSSSLEMYSLLFERLGVSLRRAELLVPIPPTS